MLTVPEITLSEKRRATVANHKQEADPEGTPKVSAVIITYNESANLRRTLSKLYWCDEVVVVDSYSTDSTVAICSEFNCTVYFNRFESYGRQKQYAVSKAKNDWVLCIDADEVLTDSLVAEIQAALKAHPHYAGFELAISLVFFRKEFLFGKESCRHFLRLFNKTKGGFNSSPVHEKVELNGPVSRLHHKILHYSYSSIQQCCEKGNRYSTLAAIKAVEKGHTKPLWLVIIALPFYFIKYYLLELNFLNGPEGFYWSVFSSYYHFIKYLKIREYYASEKRGGRRVNDPSS
jgi:glycosyltransferase involved in cell wall biosynthesis